MTEVPLHLQVDGQEHRTATSARTTLADLLRDQLGCTSVHLGCEHGACGACTVLLDGCSVRACVTLAAQAHGRRVTTVAGLSPADGSLSELQQELSAAGGLQCGFCTPGFVVAATELLERDPSPDEAAVREALSGNLCRCTGYEGIVDAVLARSSPGETSPPSWDDGPPPERTGPGRPPSGPPSGTWHDAPRPESLEHPADAHVEPRGRGATHDPSGSTRWLIGGAAAALAGLVAIIWNRRRSKRRS